MAASPEQRGDRDSGATPVALATDLYELTMAASYRALGMNDRATFSLFVRRLPERRSFLVAAGLDEALSRLERFGFDEAAADYLASTGMFRREDAEALARVHFTGDVRAVREGRIVFPGEPLLEVDAPILEAQLAETLVLNAVHFPTMVASKAARCVAAARGKSLVDFSLRRAPGNEAGLAVARACWLTGFSATSNVLAGMRLGIPISGTVAHSFIEALASERAAFDAWTRTSPEPITLLVDTYDTMHGVRLAVEIARQARARGRRVGALRLDSGDLDALSREARRVLDDAGLRDVRIFASGGLDELSIDALVRANAPIDGFGVGTHLGTAADAPVSDMAYKLVAYAGRACLKLSERKATVAFGKQVFRRQAGGCMVEDVIGLRDEPSPGAQWEALLEPVMREGRRIERPTLEALRARHAEEVRALPPELGRLDAAAPYPVSLSAELASRQRAAVEEIRRREGLARE